MQYLLRFFFIFVFTLFGSFDMYIEERISQTLGSSLEIGQKRRIVDVFIATGSDLRRSGMRNELLVMVLLLILLVVPDAKTKQPKEAYQVDEICI